jgi:hypothetical protein
MLSQLATAPIGSAFPVDIERDPNHLYLYADTIAASTALTGELELALLSFQGRPITQKFVVVSPLPGATSSAKGMTAQETIFDTFMIQTGTIRMQTAVAIDAASVIISHLIKSGYDVGAMRQKIEEALRAPINQNISSQ